MKPSNSVSMKRSDDGYREEKRMCFSTRSIIYWEYIAMTEEWRDMTEGKFVVPDVDENLSGLNNL